MAGLNVNIGIDSGTNTSKLAYSDDNGTKLIAGLEGFNPLLLREEAEIYFDEPVFSCVIALPDTFSRRQKDDVITKSKASGFKDVNIITQYEALNYALNDEAVIMVYDFGASRSDIVIIGGSEVLESVIIDDVCGNEFDRVFAEWLSDRFTLNLIDERTLRQKAEQMKITLSANESLTWREVDVMREDFERLIYFSIKRASHTANRLRRVYNPERIILTGGCSNIPIARKTLTDTLKAPLEIHEGIIAEGASIYAHSLTAENTKHKQKSNNALRLRELRAGIIEIEETLTRSQKDRLYMLFRQAEGINDERIITLMESMIHEIKEAQSQ